MSGRNSRRPIETFRDDELSNPNGAGIQGRKGASSKTPRQCSANASLPMYPAAHRTVNPFRCKPHGDSRTKVTLLTGLALLRSVDWQRYAGRADSDIPDSCRESDIRTAVALSFFLLVFYSADKHCNYCDHRQPPASFLSKGELRQLLDCTFYGVCVRFTW